MKNKIKEAFDELQAGDELKKNTLQYLKQYDRKPEKTLFSTGRVLVFASIMLILFVGGISYQTYITPVTYMDIDVNPSIELIINRFGRVIHADAYNDEGIEVLSTLNIKHQTYGDSVLLLIDAIDQAGYLDNNGLLSVTVQSDKKESEILDRIEMKIGDALLQKSIEVEPEIYAVDSDTRAHAHGAGVSPAKYLAISALMDADPTATFEECQGHSIGELREYTYRHGQNHPDSNDTEQDDPVPAEQTDTEHHNSRH